MAEAGFFSIELDQIQLALSTPLSGDVNYLRMDVEIINGPEDLRWVASGTSIVQSEKMVPFYQAPVEEAVAGLAAASTEAGVEEAGPVVSAGGDSTTVVPAIPAHKYIVGFAGKSGSSSFNRRSTYLSLSSDAVSHLANATLRVKCLLVRDAPPPPVETKKGAPPPVLTPTEEVLTEMAFPLSALVRAKGSVLADTAMPLDSAAVAAARPDWSLTATHTHAHIIGPQSILSWRVAADNDLAEYLLGGSLLTFHATLPALPAPWTLHCADVADPKAKVQPTEAEQRKKWIENIEKMVAAQGKYATYSAEIVPLVAVAGNGAGDGEPAVGGPGEAGEIGGSDEANEITLPRITLARGILSFNGELAAAAAAAEENLRLKTDLWTLSWGTSPLTFLHRVTVRRMLAAHQEASGAGSRYSLVMRKVPVAPDGVASEGAEEVKLVGEVDIAPLLGLDASGQPVESTDLVVTNIVDPSALPPTAPNDVDVDADANPPNPTDDPLPTLPPLHMTLGVSVSPPLCLVSPSLPAHSVAVASLTSRPNPLKSAVQGLAGKAVQTERDVMKDLRMEIASVVRLISQEYVTKYPTPTTVPPPTALGAPPPTGVSTVVNPDAMALRKGQFLHYLSTSGVYHSFKEKLKPKIQRVARARYGARGQALGRTASRGGSVGVVAEAQVHPSVEDGGQGQGQGQGAGGLGEMSKEVFDEILAELYVFLVKETDTVLNALFTHTVIDRDLAEFDQLGAPGATVDDEVESASQRFSRLLVQASDAESACRGVGMEGAGSEGVRVSYADLCEQLHLERIQLVNTDVVLQADPDNIHSAYARYGECCLHLAATCTTLGAALTATYTDSTDTNMYQQQALAYMNKGRQALEVAYAALPSHWLTSLHLACALIEADQREQAETVFTAVINSQLSPADSDHHPHNTPQFASKNNNFKGGLATLLADGAGAFDGYDSDKLCPVEPLCYAVLASFYTLLHLPLQARKALRLADRSYLEGDYQPPARLHGTPRRTVVYVLAQACEWLFGVGCVSLGQACVGLMNQAERAVTDKAAARGVRCDTVAFVRYALLKAISQGCLSGPPLVALTVDPWNEGESDGEGAEGAGTRAGGGGSGRAVGGLVYDPLTAVQKAQDCVLAATEPVHVILGRLQEAGALAWAGAGAGAVVEAYVRALQGALSEEQRRQGLGGLELPLMALALTPASVPTHPSTSAPRPADALTLLPVHAYLHAGRLLTAAGRCEEAYEVLSQGVRVYPSACLYLALGGAAYRLDRLDDAEDALMEATLLENRHPDAWLYLALVCIASSATTTTATTVPSTAATSAPGTATSGARPPRSFAQRTEEAEQAARQALRLLATHTPLLRELGAAFMAADRLAVAEEVVRRALAVEVGSSVTGRPHPHTRKLLADILAVQNQALLAVDEYQQVLADDLADLETRRTCADRCASLLHSLGRDEELKALRRLMGALDGTGAGARAGVMM